MADSWQRKRQPDEVPTPLAVAVSDFCRRAKVQASAVEVREALAMLTDSDEFRVRELTDQEPPARPLGPFAVVDILQGTAAELAAKRQELGYYELARALADVRAQPAPQPISSAPAPAPENHQAKITARLAELLGPGEADRRDRAAKKDKDAPKQTVAERIAPRKRGGAMPTNATVEVDPDRDDALPAPRGRFTRLDAPRESLSSLMGADARDHLASLVEQHPTRVTLLRTVSTQFQGRKGTMDFEDLIGALARHGLDKKFLAREREVVLSAVTDHRGAFGRTSWELDVSGHELRTLIEGAGLKSEVEEIRERFRREALAPKNLKLRLDLLGRSKYLDDLGIRRKFTERLSGDLHALFRETIPDAGNFDNLIEITSKRHAVDATTLRRAVERLDLADTLSKQVAGASAAHSP